MSDDLYSLPKLDICQVPMAANSFGNLRFCRHETDAISLFDFELHIRADEDEWELEDLFFGNDMLGLQRVLPGPFFDFIEIELAKRFESEIQSHIGDHLPEAVAEAVRKACRKRDVLMGRMAS